MKNKCGSVKMFKMKTSFISDLHFATPELFCLMLYQIKKKLRQYSSEVKTCLKSDVSEITKNPGNHIVVYQDVQTMWTIQHKLPGLR